MGKATVKNGLCRTVFQSMVVFYRSSGLTFRIAMRSALFIFSAATLFAQDAREIVRKSVESDQISWQRAKDYAWVRRVETHVHGGKAKDYSRTFESIILWLCAGI